MASLIAACVVSALRPDAGTVGITAIDKRPATGAVKLGRLGLYADVQADRKNHGGADKAVYAYAQEDADFWSAELGRDLPPGWFGENLRVSGLDVTNARVGERWKIGATVEIEVTMPRSPCATFARWVGGADQRGWVKRFGAEGRLGAYLRVIRTGPVCAGDKIELLSAPADAPTILEVFRG
ncbi:MOSC domain-containing protein [Glaciihabitans sp. GrIS 2.15]|uniref:MOSC domain-containing protein n=1 Tax=Glaciihabitans sp. GrIS 2.15 TaxID=3071710 RepID=UPI002DFB54D1|nr:MOSC domain-containing protein YiiM [Glaciihabitans sp. GrIS 2.15]